MRRLLIGLYAAAWVLGPVAAAAAGTPEPPGGTAPDLFTAGLKTAGTLLLLIGGLLLALYLLRRFGAARSGLFGGHDLIRVIGTKALAPRKYIALVEVGDTVLTLGVTQERITRLDKTPARVFRQAAGPDSPSGFAGRLRALAGRGRPDGGEERS
ncbi:MAG: flagellar biosynthetic protein FliO [Thermodesulfobacteriota bacterium]